MRISGNRVMLQRAAIAALLGSASAAGASADTLAPVARWSVEPDLSTGTKEATNLSGAACAISGPKPSCLLIGDEVRYARFFTYKEGDGQIVPGEPIYLLPKRDADGEFDETDAEGIAFSGGYYYLVGSHGLNPGGGHQRSRYFTYRFQVDPPSGRVSDTGSPKKAAPAVERSGKLETILASEPTLKPYLSRKPGKDGVNIEGLAVSGDTLFVGLRGPVLNGEAPVLQVPVDAVFGTAAPAAKLDWLALGKGQGVRDLAAVEGGLLILSGPESRVKPGPAEIFFWKPGSVPRRLADLGKPEGDDGNPEVLLVLPGTPSAYRLLVMSDGPANGAPRLYEVRK